METRAATGSGSEAGESPPQSVDDVADRTIGYLSGAAVAGLVYLGDQLGLYRALSDAGPVTSGELAERVNLNERWVREWLHGQASAGLVRYAGGNRFELTSAQSAVLADEHNPAFAAGGFELLMPLLGRWEQLYASFRTGKGAPYNDLGQEHASGESRFSRPWMRANLVSNILPALDGVTAKLAAGATGADIGCGSGAALVEMAEAYPASTFHGYDSSDIALRLAETRIRRAGADNITLHDVPADSLEADEPFDFVLTWDCMHDMTDPAAAARSIRRVIAGDGTWLIVDVNGTLTPEGNYENPLGGLLYSFSVLDCLGCSTSVEGGAALGTLGFTEQVAREMTTEAGFTRFAVHDFGNPLNSFFEVRP